MLNWIRRHTFPILLGIAMAISAVWLLSYRSQLGFMADDWTFIVFRGGWSVSGFVEPHNEHISVLLAGLYRLSFSLFGIDSAMPLHVLSVGALLGAVGIVFAYLRKLVGDAASLLGCVALLFLGSAYQDLLWSFQIAFSISIAGGVGALLLLDRNDRKGDIWACFLLSVSVLSSLGVPFAIGAAVALLLRRETFFRRMFVFAVPLGIYAVWWLRWGHHADSQVSISNALATPQFIFDAIAYTVATFTGLFRLDGSAATTISRALTVVLAGAIAFKFYRERKVPPPFLVAVAIGLTTWGLLGLSQFEYFDSRSFDQSRYQLPSAILVLMIVAGAFEKSRIRPGVIAGLVVLAGLSVFSGIAPLERGYSDGFKPLSDQGLIAATSLDIAGDQVDPAFVVEFDQLGFSHARSDEYNEAVERYGPAGWSADELSDESSRVRAQIDAVLKDALPIRVERTSGPMGAFCREIASSLNPPPAELVTPVIGAELTVRPEAEVGVFVGRLADDAPIGVAPVPAGVKATVDIPPDESSVPWRVGFAGTGRVRVCSSQPFAVGLDRTRD